MSLLKNFLIQANKAGYASGDLKSRTRESDGFTTIAFSKDNWRMVDNYIEGEPYSGCTKIFFKNKIVFMMVYYGAVNSKVKNIKKVYAFLIKALSKMPENHPYRGPKKFKEKNWEYINKWTGEVDQFSGQEKILFNNKTIFWTKYIGGLVDQRKK